jgi:hypothetical protein
MLASTIAGRRGSASQDEGRGREKARRSGEGRAIAGAREDHGGKTQGSREVGEDLEMRRKNAQKLIRAAAA